MLNKLIQWSLANRAIIIGISLLLLVTGLADGDASCRSRCCRT